MIGQMSIVGGQQSFMMNYFRHIDKSRFHVDFLGVHGYSSPYEKEIRSLGSNLYYWNNTFGFRELFVNLTKLVRFIKKGNYDVVHSNIYLGNCWFLVAAKLAGVKVRISHSHCSFPLAESTDGLFMRFYHSVIQRVLLLYNSTHYFACGEEAGRALYGNRSFKVIRNGIDLDIYTNIESDNVENVKKELSISENARVYASISRFDENKNLIYAVKLFEKIIDREPDAILIIGGAEPYEDSTHKSIEDYIKSTSLENNIRVVGTRNDLPIIMQFVDCWLFPSYHEGLPIVGIELQAASVNVIASDTITNEMDMGLGLVRYIPLEDEQSWLDSALHCRRNLLPEEMIHEAFIKKGYSIKDCVSDLEEYYS